MTLEATTQLRWIESEVGQRVLQQWGRDVQTAQGEWRDVPLEEE